MSTDCGQLRRTFVPVVAVEDAIAAVTVVHARARDRSLRVAVAVVDGAGDVVAFARMDETVPVAVRLACAKARAAAGFGVDTRRLAETGAAAPALSAAFAGALGREMALVPGGVPLIIDGMLCGAVGVGGARPDEDHELAVAAVQLLGGRPPDA